MNARQLRKARPLIESEIERMIAALDLLDGDFDLEPQCEDEGAQCDDEGVIDGDLEPWEDFLPRRDHSDWRAAQAEQDEKNKAVVAAVEGVRAIMKRKGKQPIQSVRMCGSAIAR